MHRAWPPRNLRVVADDLLSALCTFTCDTSIRNCFCAPLRELSGKKFRTSQRRRRRPRGRFVSRSSFSLFHPTSTTYFILNAESTTARLQRTELSLGTWRLFCSKKEHSWLPRRAASINGIHPRKLRRAWQVARKRQAHGDPSDSSRRFILKK